MSHPLRHLLAALLLPGLAAAQPPPSEAPSHGDDLYQAANGGWLATASLPSDKASWNSIWPLVEQNLAVLRAAAEAAAADRHTSRQSAARKVGDFYASGMDTRHIEKKGLRPRQDRPAARPGRVEHDAAHRQCHVQPHPQ